MTAVRERIEGNEGVDTLGKLAGVDSIANNLEAEDAEYKRSLRDHEMSNGSPSPAEASHEMRNMAARDIHVYQRPEPTEPIQAPDVPQLPVKPAGSLARLALMGALLSTGAAGGLGIPWALGLFDQQPPPAKAVDQDTKYVGGIRVE